jgi:hypothetical protein
MRQKNAGTEQRNKRGGQLKHRTQSLNESARRQSSMFRMALWLQKNGSFWNAVLSKPAVATATRFSSPCFDAVRDSDSRVAQG